MITLIAALYTQGVRAVLFFWTAWFTFINYLLLKQKTQCVFPKGSANLHYCLERSVTEEPEGTERRNGTRQEHETL